MANIKNIIHTTKPHHAALMRSAVFVCIVPQLAADFNHFCFISPMAKTANYRRHCKD